MRVRCALAGRLVEFPFANFDVPAEHLTFRGSGRPSIDAARQCLHGGTQLLGGTFDLNNTFGTQITDLGIDVSTVSGRDAMRSGGQGSSERRCSVRQVTTLGSGGSHGLVFTSGGGNEVHGFMAVRAAHGLVFRCGDSLAADISAEHCSLSGITLKSHPSFGDCIGNVVTSFRLVDSRLVITAHGSTVTNANSVAHGTIVNSDWGMSCTGVSVGGTRGIVAANTVSDVQVRSSTRHSFAMQNVASGLVQGCRSYQGAARGFWAARSSDIDLVDCRSSGDAGGPYSGTFRTTDVLLD